MSITDSVEIWASIDERQREIRNESKELKERKTLLETLILQHMIKNQVDSFTCKDGSRCTRKGKIVSGGLNKDYIKESLLSYFKQKNKPTDPSELAEQTTESIMKNREQMEKQVLLRKMK
jgi:RNA recognition motif-containing protein